MNGRRRPLAREAALSLALALLSPVVAALGCGDDSTQACASGTICTFAGIGKPELGNDGLDRRATALYWPMDIDFAPDGRGYLLDWQNHLVRRVNSDDKLEIVIGTDTVGDGPDNPAAERTPPGVPGTTVNLNHPTDLAFASDGTLLLAAWHNHKIRALDPATGLVDVSCGNGPGFTGDGGPAATALMNRPKAVAVDPTSGAIYVVDAANVRVRRIDPAAPEIIETVAGNGMHDFTGDGGPPLGASFAFQQMNDNPEPGGGIAVDSAGLLYIVDTENQRIRRVDLGANTIETIAGTGEAGFSGDGGPATSAALNYPRDAEIGPDGRLYIADTDNHRVRAIDLTTGLITTVAGDGMARFGGDGGSPLRASFNRPFGIAFDAGGALYVSDTFNNRIRRINP
jgi:DNA-binding beta-propeller fold protein YncE